MGEKEIQDRRRWQKVFDETFPVDGVNLIFVMPDMDPEESDNNLITPRLMVHGVGEDDVPYVTARPAIGLGYPAVRAFAAYSIEDYPSPGPPITFSKMIREAFDSRIWVVNLHAEAAKKACLETRRGPTGYYFSDARYDADLRD